MKKIWAPWRIGYLTEQRFQNLKKNKNKSKSFCPLCESQLTFPSLKTLVLYKGQKTFVIMNKYPYANGHLMVVPKRHVGELTKVSGAEHAEMGSLLAFCEKILHKSLECDGFNIGMNLGAAAGAGIIDHIHYHIVPRWSGDHNFMSTLAEIRVIPEDLRKTYQRLKKCFNKL